MLNPRTSTADESVCRLASVDSDLDHVILVVKSSVKVAEENSPEAILILIAAILFNIDYAPPLLRIIFPRVSRRPDCDRCRLQLEADVFQLRQCDRARLVSLNSNTVVEICNPDKADAIVDIGFILGLNLIKNIVEDDFGQLNGKVAGVDDGDLRDLTLCHVNAVINDFINHKTPLVFPLI